MERLTYKNYIEEYEVNFEKNSEKQWSIAESDTHIKVTGQPIDRLAEFEDFIEEQGFEDLQSLKDTLYQTNMELYSMIKLQKENQALKDRWQKLKEFVITNKNSMFLNDMPTARMYLTKVLDKMEEFEKEIK